MLRWHGSGGQWPDEVLAGKLWQQPDQPGTAAQLRAHLPRVLTLEVALKGSEKGGVELLATALLAPSFENTQPCADGARDSRVQEAGLADAGLAGEHQQGRSFPGKVALQQRQLAYPPDERRVHPRLWWRQLATRTDRALAPSGLHEYSALVGRQGQRNRQPLQGIPARRVRLAPLHLRNAAAAYTGTLRQLLLRESRRHAVTPQ
jgi:hypothetical protein